MLRKEIKFIETCLFIFYFFLYLAFYCLLLKQTLTNSSCALESSALDYPAVAQVLWKPHKKK